MFLGSPCDRHDFDYWVGGGIIDRWRADWRLLSSGLKLANLNPAKIAACFVYWNAVRAGGVLCFHYGRKCDEKDLERFMRGEPLVEDYWNGDKPVFPEVNE